MFRFDLPWSRFPHPDGEDVRPRTSIRWRLWLSIAVIFLVLMVGLAIWLAPAVERNLAARAVHDARELVIEQDYRRAQLVLEQAVQSNPGDFATRRELARFYEDAGFPRALVIWRGLVELEPNNDADRVALATCALRMNNVPVAREALKDVSQAGRSTVDYHRAVAAVALRVGDQTTLEKELAELALLEPDNPRAQFNHAAVELGLGGRMGATRAVLTLENLARGDVLRLRATLELIRATSRSAYPNYSALAERILPRRHGLTYLLTWAAPKRGLYELIAYMQSQPKPTPEDAAQLGDWMRRQGLVTEASFWLGELDPAVRRSQPVLDVRATCAAQLKDWRLLEDCLRDGAWGRCSEDALDLAFAALLQRDSNRTKHAEATWDDALEAAGRSLGSLHVLLHLAGQARWTEATEASLERIVRVDPVETESWSALVAIDIAQGATARLLRLYLAWMDAQPDNVVPRAGQIWVTAVLNRGWPSSEPEAGSPLANDPAWVAARAFGLHTAGEDDEALARLDRLPEAAAQDRRVQLVRGVILADLGRPEESERALAAAAANPLLPQESALVVAARARNASRK